MEKKNILNINEIGIVENFGDSFVNIRGLQNAVNEVKAFNVSVSVSVSTVILNMCPCLHKSVIFFFIIISRYRSVVNKKKLNKRLYNE